MRPNYLLFLLTLFLLNTFCVGIHAQNQTPKLCLSVTQSGEKTFFDLNDIRKLTFRDNNTLRLDKLGGISHDFSISAISKLSFENGEPSGVILPSSDQELYYHPNPVNDRLTIASDNVIGNVRMYDLEGRVLINQSYSGHAAEIEMSGFSNGVYILKTSTNTYKIIKN